MSWHFSQALVEGFSEANSSDGERSEPSKSIPTAYLLLPKDRMTAFSRLSRFGMTFQPFEETTLNVQGSLKLFGASLTASLSQVDSPARTSALQELETDLRGCVLASGLKCAELLAKYDQDTSSWKTAQPSLFAEECESLTNLPRWGMCLGGELWGLGIEAVSWNESGFGLPAPTKSMGKRGWGISSKKFRWSAQLERNALTFGMRPHPSLLELIMGWIPMWTRLKPLGMDKYQAWLNSHGKR